jgi:DNA-binding response OmpR family regulator
VCLEAVIRFDLGHAPDLLAWQEFEECLVTPTELHSRLEKRDVVADVQTNIGLIERIRRMAGSEAGPDPLPYYAGLLVWAVRAMARYEQTTLYTRDEQMRGAHLLLAAAMIARRLTETPSLLPPALGGTLSLDADGTVWIGDRCGATLSGQELALLRLLFQRGDRILPRRAIVESVFGEQYSEGNKYQETRINTLVGRLRRDVEPDPSHPKYIRTLRGKGYRLYRGGRPNR